MIQKYNIYNPNANLSNNVTTKEYKIGDGITEESADNAVAVAVAVDTRDERDIRKS